MTMQVYGATFRKGKTRRTVTIWKYNDRDFRMYVGGKLYYRSSCEHEIKREIGIIKDRLYYAGFGKVGYDLYAFE